MIQMPTIQIISLSKTMLQGKLLLAVFLQEALQVLCFNMLWQKNFCYQLVLFNFFFTFQIQTQNMLGLLVYLKKKNIVGKVIKFVCLILLITVSINQEYLYNIYPLIRNK